MTRRTKVLIGTGSLIVIAIVALYLLLRARQTTPPVTPAPSAPAVENRRDGGAQVIGTAEPTPESTALRTARFVAERYGTFSSDEGLRGVQELVAVSTPKMVAWLTEVYIPQIASQMKEGTFYAESSRVLSASITELNDTNATVHLRLQRQITQGTEEQMRNSEVDISLLRDGDSWLVASIFENR